MIEIIGTTLVIDELILKNATNEEMEALNEIMKNIIQRMKKEE